MQAPGSIAARRRLRQCIGELVYLHAEEEKRADLTQRLRDFLMWAQVDAQVEKLHPGLAAGLLKTLDKKVAPVEGMPPSGWFRSRRAGTQADDGSDTEEDADEDGGDLDARSAEV